MNKQEQKIKTTTVIQSFNHILYITLLHYRITKQVRKQYGLTINLSLILIGIYLLHSLRQDTTMSNILRFVAYFDSHRIRSYLGILIDKGMIRTDNNDRTIVYMITQAGNQVINEINESYDNVIYNFCQKYNIVL